MNSVLGIGCVLVFGVLQGVGAVFLSSFLQRIPLVVVLFSVYALVSIFFNLGLLKELALQRNKALDVKIGRSCWRLLVVVNLTTAASASSFFCAVKYIEPALSSSFINAVLPLATIGVDYMMCGRKRIELRTIGPACALLAAMVLTAAVAFSDRSGVTGDTRSYVIGLGMAAVCGCAMSITNVASRRLNDAGLSPKQIMGSRFLLVTLGSGMIAGYGDLASGITEYWMPILAVAVIGNLVPLYALQLGILRLRPVTVAFLIGLGPMITFVLQGLNSDIRFSWPSFATTAFTTTIVLVGAWVSLVSATRSKPANAPHTARVRSAVRHPHEGVALGPT